MKNKKMRILISLIIFMITILFANISFAVENNEKITLTSTINNVSNNISNTFTYQIEPVFGNPKGGLNETKTIEVKFDNVTPNANNQVSTNYEIDFSNIEFSEIGVYKYIVSEIDSSDKKTFPISNNKYEIYVQTTPDGEKIVKRVHNQALDINANEKSNLLFEHEAKYTNIKVRNSLIGNLSNSNEYFKYKLTILGNVGDTFKITGQDKEVVFGGRKITTQDYYTIKEGQDNFVYIYLRKDQIAQIGLLGNGINQIPIGTKYKVEIIGARKWNTKINEVQTKETDFLTASENPEENEVIVVNEADFDVAITGVFINILPFIILIIIGAVGVVFMVKSKKNDEDDK